MRKLKLILIVLGLLAPAALRADDQEPKPNVNSRYTVEAVELAGIPDSRVSKALRDEIQKLVGEKFSQDSADALTEKLRKELPGYTVKSKLKKGDKPESVTVVFQAERTLWRRFEVAVPPVVYHSKQGLSGALELPLEFHHSVLTFGMVNSADELLERNAGFRFRFEQNKVGTDLLQFRIDFNTYHQKWNPATEAALALDPTVPGIYRSRQELAPSLSLTPHRDLRLSAGTSLESLEIQYPAIHYLTANAATADVQYRHRVEGKNGVRQNIRLAYSLRSAFRPLDSDLVYTRQIWTADYTVSQNKNLIGVHFRGGRVTGSAPLFDRFSIGNSFDLRGWNKFDVAPVGGARLAYGSIEYRYRPLQVFYDVGAVWDAGQSAHVRHGLGFGLFFKDGAFLSLAFPLRHDNAAPVVMFGFRH
jgi:hypothetical protein